MAAKQPMPFSPDGLLSVVERLENSLTDLKVVRDGMTERSIEELQILYAKGMLKGLDQVEAFTLAAKQAYHERRLGHGNEDAKQE